MYQEFLDVLPVHQFVYGSRGWCEKLVDIDDSPQSPLHFRMCLSPSPTPAMLAIFGNRLQPQSSYAFLKSIVDKADVKSGDGIETSPLALSVVQQIASTVCHSGGAALIIDYGEDSHQADTLRGFRKHRVVDVLSEPGNTDVTADVVCTTVLLYCTCSIQSAYN
jgi:NADH dehydrogenase [ubiquinone] 1 alpha subcomplex assembly factor 7